MVLGIQKSIHKYAYKCCLSATKNVRISCCFCYSCINKGPENAYYYSVQNLATSSLLSKNINITIYSAIPLPVVLYGCETWSLTLREECRLRVFENRVLRRIFGPYREEVTRELRKLHNEELNDLYFTPNTVWVIKSRMIWVGHVACSSG
jgi:hypothetical protein